MVAVHWPQFPDRIPTHFDISGKPNGWHGKAFLLVLPGTAALVCLIMTLAQRNQRLINIPVSIDRDSPEVQIVLNNMMIAEKTTMALLFAWLMQGMVRTALGSACAHLRAADCVFGETSAFPEVNPLRFLAQW